MTNNSHVVSYNAGYPAGLNEHKRKPPCFERNRLIFSGLHHPAKTFMFAVKIVHLNQWVVYPAQQKSGNHVLSAHFKWVNR